MRHHLLLSLIGLSMVLCPYAVAEGLTVSGCAEADGQTPVYMAVQDGVSYLMLPACVKPQAVRLCADAQGTLTVTGEAGRSAAFASGDTVDVAALFAAVPKDGRYPVTVTAESGASAQLTLLFSENIAAVFIKSSDPACAGRAYIDGSLKHETDADGCLTMLREDGTAVYNGGLTNIRGRGNTSWGNYPLTANTYTTVDKKPYQIKLSNKADLMETGEERELGRTWVLLAEYYDGTLQHNRISFELARELGQTDAPRCRPVDLYYDGQYRGQYLLCEKVEAGKGRVDVTDYQEVLKTLNKDNGVDVEAQPQAAGENSYGCALTATENVLDAGETNLGGYLVELDNAYFAAERAHFTLRCGATYVLRNPEYATLAMVRYLSELFEETDGALNGYGINPDTGLRWTDYIDAESTLPYLWVNLLAQNPDAWMTSSTYFVLPEGGGKLRMGPVWDFDVAYCPRGGGECVTDLFGREAYVTNWARSLLCIPQYQTMAKAFLAEKVMPAVQVLLGGEDARGETLRSLAWYWQETAASRRMNDVLWNPEGLFTHIVSDTYEGNYQSLRTFLKARYQWLVKEAATWPESKTPETVDVTLTAPYANVENRSAVTLDDLHVNVKKPALTLTQESEATETAFAAWRAEIRIDPKPDVPFAPDVRVRVNGTQAALMHNADGSLTATVWFTDPSYRPAVLDDTDYGLVFDADYCRAHYPEIVEECGGDAQALLAWYVETGMGEGVQANAFFSPAEALAAVPEIADLYGDGPEAAVLYFLESGYEDLMNTLDRTFAPTVMGEK